MTVAACGAFGGVFDKEPNCLGLSMLSLADRAEAQTEHDSVLHRLAGGRDEVKLRHGMLETAKRMRNAK